MQKLAIDTDYMRETLRELLAIPSPVGLTDEAVHYTCHQLRAIGIPYELTRRGAIRGKIAGEQPAPARALIAHLDTLGACVRTCKANGRLGLLPLGTWSSRFAEGARVTVFTDRGHHRGTILPLLASGHAFNDRVDDQPIAWEHVELRLDDPADCAEDLYAMGLNVGDFVAVDPQPEFIPNGYINSRHLDDKAAVAALLAACKALVEAEIRPPVDLYPMFTVTEEVGFGASAILHPQIGEMVGLDIAINAPGQNTSERAVTIAIQDSSGPFDYHLTRQLLHICAENGVRHQRDVFPYYFSDSAAALRAGHDIRHALLGFGADASHGYERTHMDALVAMAELVTLYSQASPAVARDRARLGSIEGFPHQVDFDELGDHQERLPDPRDFLDPAD
jgi:peptidase M42 family hydrolase